MVHRVATPCQKKGARISKMKTNLIQELMRPEKPWTKCVEKDLHKLMQEIETQPNTEHRKVVKATVIYRKFRLATITV